MIESGSALIVARIVLGSWCSVDPATATTS
jgi:hypothetical protein